VRIKIELRNDHLRTMTHTSGSYRPRLFATKQIPRLPGMYTIPVPEVDKEFEVRISEAHIANQPATLWDWM
jgi:hypothetical protein